MFTFLNVFGLATGMACSILILLWVQDETSYDKFNLGAERMFRLTANVAGTPAAVTPPPILPAIKQQIPGIQMVTRVVPVAANVTIGTQKFTEKKILYADLNFFQMFNYPLLYGKTLGILDNPGEVVLTEETAVKYFGSKNVIGKTIHVDNDINGNDYQVTGVLKNIPHNSHLQFGLLLPIDFYDRDNGQVWDNFATYSYIRLVNQFSITPNSIKMLEKQIDNIYKANESNIKSNFNLQPLADIHLHSRLAIDVDGQGNNQYVTIFFIVALFILLLACINFMNLYTALGSQRAKEVGLRKTIGASRSQLVAQFMSESMLVAFCSLVIGCCIAILLLPLFNELSGKAMTIDLLNFKQVAGLVALAIIVGIVSGSYPAFFMSAFNPVKVLKGLKVTVGRFSYLRNGLVIFQFVIAVILIVSTIVVNYQLRFIKNRDIGFSKQNLMYLEMPRIGDLKDNYQALKASLLQRPDITDYTFVDHLPTNLTSATNDVTWKGKNSSQQILFPHIGIDDRFVKTFGMQLLAGRGFNEQVGGDDNNYVLNEKAVKQMGMTIESAIGQKISSKGHEGYIIGIVKDFNFKPVQQLIEPLIMKHTSHGGYLVLRTTPEKLQSFIGSLKEIFKGVYPNAPFAYGFVDEDISKMYVAEQRMSILFNTFSVISIIVSCLGLFGLAAFATQRRIKEIGVRRVLGASVLGLTGMLMKDFIKLVVLSLVIAFPIAWYCMNIWLTNYAYKIELNWWFFAVAGIAAITIALLTISYQSIKAAISNPVESLRSE